MTAILIALRSIGGKDAIPYVEALADHTGMTPAERGVCEAARDTLAAIWDRLDRSSSREGLLRPSSAPDDAAKELVRPAHASADEVAGEMLRGTDKP